MFSKLILSLKKYLCQPLNVLIVFSLAILFCPQKALLSVKSCVIGVITNSLFQNYFTTSLESSAQEQIASLQQRCILLEESNEFLREQILAQKEKNSVRLININEDDPGRKISAMQAKIICRDPSSWGSFVWVNVGERDNAAAGIVVVAKNSPVITGNYLVGVVEEVLSKRSLVRLITDRHCVPSVCGLQGGGEYRLLSDQIDRLVATFDLYPGMALSANFLQDLYTLRKQLNSSFGEERYALGNVRGMSLPLWSQGGRSLEGFGFHVPRSWKSVGEKDCLLQKGDLLVTSGKDGIFPENLFVGKVTKIASFEEGALSYNIDAQTIIPKWDQLKYVLILTPLK